MGVLIIVVVALMLVALVFVCLGEPARATHAVVVPEVEAAINKAEDDEFERHRKECEEWAKLRIEIWEAHFEWVRQRTGETDAALAEALASGDNVQIAKAMGEQIEWRSQEKHRGPYDLPMPRLRW